MEKPEDVFDREWEWESLAQFSRPGAGFRFGLIYGRRRQGKSYLAERVATATEGWYWEATQGTNRQQLGAFAAAWPELSGGGPIPRFDSWAQALQELWKASPPLVVFDEFQYLVESDPTLPSVLQTKVSRPAGPHVLICGSAMGAMRDLLAGSAPLRGRASLELVIRPFDFRASAEFWQLGEDWDSAARLHALVGGTPAFRGLAGGRLPEPGRGLDDWITGTLFNPSSALFREGRLILEEEPVQDRNLYVGTLAAIAGGATRRGQIASALGRAESSLAHVLNSLVELALVERLEDPLHGRRSTFHLAEPMLRTYRVLIAPREAEIISRGPKWAWRAARDTASAQVYGPHFEHLAREWARGYATERTLGGSPEKVGPSVVPDPSARQSAELDLVVRSGDTIVSIGEAKWTKAEVAAGGVSTLEYKRALLGPSAAGAKLLLFAPRFAPELRSAMATRSDVELIDLERLYTGD
ncbi:MAG: ATP-binding protein [Actinobacteria bacterium]|nr:ATP-binding protein [Actinomycetota bacterium]